MKLLTLSLFIIIALSSMMVKEQYALEAEIRSTVKEQNALEAEIRSTWNAFIVAWEQEDAAACAGFYTSEGINIPPGSEIRAGREAIADFYSGLFEANAGSRYRHETLSLEVCGNSAVERGEFEVNWVRNDGRSWTFRARCMAHWERQADGTWKKKLFLYNTPPAVKTDG